MNLIIDRIRYIKNSILRPRVINAFGVKLKDGPHINKNIKRFLYLGWYEKQEVVILEKVLKETDTVLEIGGGLGFLASFCAKKLGSHNVFTVEANPALIEVMKENFILNNVDPHMFNLVLSNTAGDTDFFVEDSFWSSSTIKRGDKAKKITVEKCSFDEFHPKTKANFLVIDIEGGELDLIPAINFDDINKVLIELHPHIIGNDGVTKVMRSLLENSFVVDFELSSENVYYFYKQ